MPDSNQPLGGSLPGAMSKRADLGPAGQYQKKRIVAGGDYGSAKKQEQLQSARPLKQGDAPPSPTGPPSVPDLGAGPVAARQMTQNRPPGIPLTLASKSPQEIMDAVGHPSAYPQETLGTPNPAQAATFRLQVLRQLATLPYASEAIRSLVPQAEAEVNAHSLM